MFVFHHDQINMSGAGFYLLCTFTNGAELGWVVSSVGGCCQKGFGSSMSLCQQALSLFLSPLTASGRAELCPWSAQG